MDSGVIGIRVLLCEKITIATEIHKIIHEDFISCFKVKFFSIHETYITAVRTLKINHPCNSRWTARHVFQNCAPVISIQ